jgi:oligo-1,6-glucosidase
VPQIYGDFTLLAPAHTQIFAFTRALGEGVLAFVVLNFSTEDVLFDTSEVAHLRGKVKLTFSNYPVEKTALGDSVQMRGYEGRVYLL